MADYNSFKNEWSGRKVDYDHVFDFQCVDEVRQFLYEVDGITASGGVPTAISYWTNTPPAILEKYDRIETTDAQQGDIVILRTRGHTDLSGDGHIGLADHEDANNVYLLEQNMNGSGTGDGYDAIGVYRGIPKSRIIGVLRHKPAPPPPPPPAPKAVYTYERLSAPMNVRVKPNCNLWNLDYTGGYANAQSLAVLSQTQPDGSVAWTDFVAVGKAAKQDMAEHPTYFMSAESFGNADLTGTPVYNQGVNTVDLGPVPVAAPAAAVEASAPVAVDDNHIAVHVLPPNPEAWKASFKTNDSGDYTATASTIIHDLDGKAEDMQLVKEQTVHVAGTFTGPDGIKYYRTVNATNGYTDAKGVKHDPNWRGIPLESLVEDDKIFTFQDNLIDDFKELKGYVSTRQKAIKAGATIHANANWLASRLKKRIEK